MTPQKKRLIALLALITFFFLNLILLAIIFLRR